MDQVVLYEKVKDNYFITGFTLLSAIDENLLTNFLKCSGEVPIMYKRYLQHYAQVAIQEEVVSRHKDVVGTDLIPMFKATQNLENDILDEEADLEKEKANFIVEIERHRINNLKAIPFINYIHFITLQNYFSSNGIFITSENKEDKYIEILEKDDEVMLNKLEKYLGILDELTPFLEDADKVIELKEEIEYCSDIDELHDLKIKYFKKDVNGE